MTVVILIIHPSYRACVCEASLRRPSSIISDSTGRTLHDAFERDIVRTSFNATSTVITTFNAFWKPTIRGRFVLSKGTFATPYNVQTRAHDFAARILQALSSIHRSFRHNAVSDIPE